MRHPRDHRQRHRQLRISSVRRKGIVTGEPEHAASSERVEVRQPSSISFAGFGSASPATSPFGADERLESPLARAEQEMEWLKSQVTYLERRTASSIGATERELEQLTTARDELAASAAGVVRLSRLFESDWQEESDTALDWNAWNEY